MAAECSIPVIDYLKFPNQSSKLLVASEEWGCFRLVNYHDVLPRTLMSDMKTVVRSLFDLPVEIKRRNVDGIAFKGYIALTAKNPLYEALGLYDMASRSDVDNFCSQLDVSPQQRDTILKYSEAIHELVVGIGTKLAESLGVSTENMGIEMWPCKFRINKYHFTPESVGSPGVQIHTDSGFLTILQDDEDVGGLEVMDKSGEFVPVDPWPNTLLVNLGDMAKVWSNGRFRNVKHRVQCKEAKIRVTIASFLLGPRGMVEAPVELVDDEHPRLYVPTTYEDYRKTMLSLSLQACEALALLYTPK
ncbi:putative gibberellin 3-beta-dioxygenase [Helianthus annuus]|uniref:2-oxoglutarate-dependent dioxygenase DAO n=1 Tax=Helianthus annuus TaxID=4232 RepID=A0A251TD58_HELAN|nr:2-oxoglutarate-dependent dioxygenase DAO [Helianthus annuus]KAF5798482.1 putative gibberellin 3-beta-dioxygenase [Helianthus annuus]KAJ0550067.1 putative gibberellin 3-beta-dioxygenase [Helianthus annuus]KAJ0556670.1 putative gibberellin 3-beta-dioxygenase [Helianthus annuus]KAJ0563020.1 putative gibberellin 3-beta-dioxygenase [Helianthus annuus]KAJ0728391.1 putative gibberellin 3-beta-dioxygenase [Helianthus annuus]